MDDFLESLNKYVVESVKNGINLFDDVKVKFTGEQDVLDKFADFLENWNEEAF